MRKLVFVIAALTMVFMFSGCFKKDSGEDKPAEEKVKVLTIAADVEKIAADGEDFAEISVSGKYESGKEVESQKIEIYCNEGKFDKNKLATTVAGIYTFYAKAGEIKSDIITVRVLTTAGIKWRVVNEQFVSKALLDNKIGFDGKKDINVCLPPAYDISSKNRKFPVVYFLAGYGENSYYSITMLRFNTTVNSAYEKGNAKDIVYVFLNGKHKLDGSFYVNSAMGRWEDYVYKDVLEVVEGKYRVKTTPESRGIGGHSMGGFGALYIAMRHPDIFGAVYCTSPGIFDPTNTAAGVERDPFLVPTVVKTRGSSYESLRNTYESDPDLFASKFGFSMFNNWGWGGVDVTYGMAFSPDDKPPYFKYPYSASGEKNDAVFNEWNMGYGMIGSKVGEYKDNWKKLKGIRIDYGTNDYFSFLILGCKYLDKQFKQEGIEAVIQGNTGDHENRTYEWAEKYMYPFFTQKLK